MSNFRNNAAEISATQKFPAGRNPGGPFAQILLEVIEDTALSAGAFRLYALLVAYSRGQGVCWLSQATLATRLGVSERSIRGWLGELEKSGLLKVEHRRTSAGQQQTNLYRLLRFVSPGNGAEAPARRKFSAVPAGNALPDPAEKSCRTRRKFSAADSYELILHDKDHINTPAVEKTGPEVVKEAGVCEVVFEDKNFEKEQTEPESAQVAPEELLLNLLEQQLGQAGISPVRARKAAHTALQNGRTTRYVEDWLRWIGRQSHIQNPAAYLLSRIEENTEVPRARSSPRCPAYNYLSPGNQAEANPSGSEDAPPLPDLVEAETAEAEEAPETPETKFRLVVDNTRPKLEPCLAAGSPGLHLVVNNLPPSNSLPAPGLPAPELEVADEPEKAAKVDISLNTFEAESGPAVSTPESEKEAETGPASTTIDFRLKELLAQRDPRLKRVKRLEVVKETLYVAFWFRTDAESGIGSSWLADTRYFYPQVKQIELRQDREIWRE